MTGATLRGLVVLATLLLSAPALRLLAEGELTVEQAALRCGLALALSWAAGAGLSTLVSGYARAVADDAAPPPARRSDDLPTTAA